VLASTAVSPSGSTSPVLPSEKLAILHSDAPAVSPAAAQPQVYVSDAELFDSAHGAILVKDCPSEGPCVFRVDVTSDGGVTWRHGVALVAAAAADAGSPSAGDSVLGIAMVSGSDIYAYGAWLWHSTDSGASWTVVPGVPSVDAMTIDHRSAWIGVACPDRSGCASSIEAISSGRADPLPHQPRGEVGDMARNGADAYLVIRVADGISELEVSRDDGATWQGRALPQQYCGYSLGPGPLAVTSANDLYLICSAGAGAGGMTKDLFVSHDEGGSWQHLGTLETYGYADSMVAATPNLLWRFGGRAPIYVSRNAGRTWQAELADKLGDAAGPMTQAFAATGTDALAFGFAMPPDPSFEGPWTINEYRSTDAGAGWSTLPLQP
jgi:hypothetical protein